MPSDKKPTSPRVLVVDAVRGLAVLCMMQWHCSDAWIGGGLRSGRAFEITRIVGGLAAPLFLLLAGLSAALVFRPERVWSGVRRGAGIVVGGYGFKLLAWTVDYGAIVERRNWLAIGFDALTLGLAWRMTEEKATRKQRPLLAFLVVLAFFATWFAQNGATRTPSLLVRLDVLQGIGAALIVVNGLLYVVHRSRNAPVVLLIAALVVALATPLFVGVDLWPLPQRLADYVARTTADPALSAARFPLFHWGAYAVLGASIGTALRQRPPSQPWAMPLVPSPWLALALAIVVALNVFEPTPTARWVLARYEPLRTLFRVLWNASAAVGLAAVSSMFFPRLLAAQRVVLSLGRHSLIVYVVHLEIAYGLPCSPIRETLGFGGWAIGLCLLVAAMIGLAFYLDHRGDRERATARSNGEAAVATTAASTMEAR